jgi:DNA processing protein
MAADQGREVFAVPGHPFDPRAGGPNSLIRDGATLISSAADVLDSLARRQTMRIVRESTPIQTSFSMAEPDANTLDDARAAVCDVLSTMPVGVDELIRDLGIPTPVIQIVLLELELGGRLVRHPQNRVSLLFHDEGMDMSASLL